MEIAKEVISFGSAGAVFYFMIKYERDKIFKSVIGLEVQDKLYTMLRQFQPWRKYDDEPEPVGVLF